MIFYLSFLLAGWESPADLIVHDGKIVTVDHAFSIHEAMAVREGRIVKLGSDAEVLELRGPKTDVVNLRGRTVMPGLIDSHVHPVDAALTEFDHAIPDMETVADVLRYVRDRAAAQEPGTWIGVRQV